MRISVFLIFLSVGLLLGSCAASNRYDRNSMTRGRWRTYYDSNSKHITGKYRHGRPVGTFRYYAPTGTLDHSERYGDDGLCEVTYWHPSGKVARRGTAQWVTGAKGARFYWYGPWTSFDEDGQITSIQTYTDGTVSRTETYELGKLTHVEIHDNAGKVTRAETYQDGNLLRVETFEQGRRTGSSLTL
ncbi:toxin-antitoxin system YwqK family antitoxin [Hymenobacter arizonensis]|uniref:MORN repeat variant n=1 Tax=Hymenobacter arizonensis TaxID=1227077 RepID=A0A1I5XFF4_HYMAR|nr:hypothetical protein [Hymenobacter arizonensis]SFQ30698.1 MORN repeat variant [Hymenobacter arizonensis]